MSDLKVLYEPDYKEHVNMAKAALDISRGIQTKEEYGYVCDFLFKVKERIKAWADRFDPRIEDAYKTHRNLISFKKEVLAPLVKAEKEVLSPAILEWERKETARLQIEQEERNRIERDQEESRRLNLAAQFEKSGNIAEAEKILAKPVEVRTVTSEPAARQDGISFRDSYSAEVFDIRALCRGVADGEIQDVFVLPNMTTLNSMARALKGSMDGQWQRFGVRVKRDRILAARIKQQEAEQS